MKIIEIKLQDLEELARVEVESLKRFVPNGGDVNSFFPSDTLDSQRRLHQWLNYLSGAASPQEARPERVAFKACIDDKMLGFIAGHLTTRFGKDAEIESFHTVAEDENGAWGRLLLRFIEWATQHGARSLCVGIGPAQNDYKEFFLRYGAVYLNPHWIYWDDMAALARQIEAPSKVWAM
jgi:hypothetical protein